MKDTIFAIDLAKSVFEVAVSQHPGRVSQQRRLTRSQLPRFMGKQSPGTVLMEACGSAHYWGRELQRLGHQVRLLPAHDVARYRQGNKTDAADTKAILEAGRNEKIRAVPVKSAPLSGKRATRSANWNGGCGSWRHNWKLWESRSTPLPYCGPSPESALSRPPRS